MSQSKRSASDQYITEYCFETDSSYVDSNGTIWGSSVECDYYLYDDGFGIVGQGGGGGGGDPSAGTPVTNCKVPGASALINSYISMSPPMQALLASISANNGPNTQPTFTEKSLSPGTVAQADYAAHTINVDSSQFGAAERDNQDVSEVIEHELLHLWMETADRVTGVQPHPFPNEGTEMVTQVTLDDGMTLTFRQSMKRNPVTGQLDVSPGYTGYEHVLIHNIILSENPDLGDQTGAMLSAFKQASTVTDANGQPVTINDDTAKALQRSHQTSKANVTPPKLPTGTVNNKYCKTTMVLSVARAMKAGRKTSEIVTFNGDTYNVPWDGATY